MVHLSFFGGVNEIGGNKVLLEDGDVRVFLDFGQSFTLGCDFFTGWLSPRAINGLGDYFEFGLLPKIEGVYAKEQLVSTDLPYTEPKIDAVFLSHAHFDHVNHIQFLHPEIRVYLGVGTKLFLEAMEKTSSFCDYGRFFSARASAKFIDCSIFHMSGWEGNTGACFTLIKRPSCLVGQLHRTRRPAQLRPPMFG